MHCPATQFFLDLRAPLMSTSSVASPTPLVLTSKNAAVLMGTRRSPSPDAVARDPSTMEQPNGLPGNETSRRQRQEIVTTCR